MVLSMKITSDQAADAVLEMMEGLGATWANGWTRREAGCLMAVSGVPLATLNGVLVASETFDASMTARLLDEVVATGLPHCLQVRPACESDASALAAERSLVREEHVIPLMVLEDPTLLGAATRSDELSIRQLAPEEALVHSEVASVGFGAPVELFEELATPSMLATPGVRCYVGEVAGEPVTTAMGFSTGSHVSIFSVATPAQHRGNGYASAVTARAAADGLGAGATWAWLQSSPDGFSVYERLGFRTLESWSCWYGEPEAN